MIKKRYKFLALSLALLMFFQIGSFSTYASADTSSSVFDHTTSKEMTGELLGIVTIPIEDSSSPMRAAGFLQMRI